jgi:hypothetical protein
MRYVVSHVSIRPASGEFDVRAVTVEAAQRWITSGDFESLLWHPEPAVRLAISETFGIATVDHCPDFPDLQIGDEALVVHFHTPPNFSLPKDRGKLADYRFMLTHCECEIVIRVA